MDHVLNWICQGVAVAAATSGALRLLDRSRAQARYVLCGIALLVVVALPMAPFLWAWWSAPPAPAEALAAADPVLVVPAAWWTSNALLIGLYAVWCGVIAARLALSARALRHTLKATIPFPSATESRLTFWRSRRDRGRGARLVLSPAVSTAAVLGCGRPVIAVSPTLLDRLSDDELDRAVIHEWAHVQRRDDLLNVLHVVARVVAGWHPAVWWLERQLRIEREVACDEIAVRVTGSPKRYAACLTAMASLHPMRRQTASALGALSSPTLSTRVLRILSTRQLSTPARSAAAAAALGLVVGGFSVAIVSYRPVGAERSAVVADDRLMLRSPAVVHPESAGVPIKSVALVMGEVPDRASAPERRMHNRMPGSAPSATTERTAAPPPHLAMATTQLTLEPFSAEHLPVPIPGPIVVTPLHTIDARVPTAGAVSPSAETLSDGTVPPWTAAADAGVAVGRGTQKAGVATAGFFSRVGKKIARSF